MDVDYDIAYVDGKAVLSLQTLDSVGRRYGINVYPHHDEFFYSGDSDYCGFVVPSTVLSGARRDTLDLSRRGRLSQLSADALGQFVRFIDNKGSRGQASLDAGLVVQLGTLEFRLLESGELEIPCDVGRTA